jgi:chromosome partitioning protein
MAQILVIGCPKGGVAKSTTAIMLATIAARFLGLKVALVDADRNHTALKWHARSTPEFMPFDVVESANNHEELRDLRLSENYDLFIVDLAGGAGGAFAKILEGRGGIPAADFLLVPSPHMGPDLEAVTEAIPDHIPDGLAYLVVLCKVPTRSRAKAEMIRVDLREDLKWSVADTIVRQYGVYEDAWQAGQTVIDLPGQNSYARDAERDYLKLAIETFEPLGFDVELLRESVTEDGD